MTSQIIGLGGGGFTMEKTPLLDLYVLANSPKKNPRICFLPTASADNSSYTDYFEQVFGEYACTPTFLNLFSPNIRNIEKFLLNSDIIYVGGGNTKSMLAIWREWGVDKILKKAYEQGILLAGVSAGFVCWFDECVTDSIPHKYTAMPCLGLLSGSGCPHYTNSKGRPEAYQRLLSRGEISAGYAADDGVALHFIDGKMVRAVSSRPDASAYYLYQDMDSKVQEERIKPLNLNDKENLDKYIVEPLFGSEESLEMETEINS
jgi:dipeptidase E